MRTRPTASMTGIESSTLRTRLRRTAMRRMLRDERDIQGTAPAEQTIKPALPVRQMRHPAMPAIIATQLPQHEPRKQHQPELQTKLSRLGPESIAATRGSAGGLSGRLTHRIRSLAPV